MSQTAMRKLGTNNTQWLGYKQTEQQYGKYISRYESIYCKPYWLVYKPCYNNKARFYR